MTKKGPKVFRFGNEAILAIQREQGRHRPDGSSALPALRAPEPLPFPEPGSGIVTPGEVSKEVKNLERLNVSHVVEDTDEYVDLFGFCNMAAIPAGLGGIAQLIPFPVPAGQRLVVQSYEFFGIVDNAPEVKHEATMMVPYEVAGFFNFRVLINDKSAFLQQYYLNNAGVFTVFHHLPTMSETMGESNQPYGIHFVVPGGQMLNVDLVRVNIANPSYWADIQGFGARIRGFLTSNYQGKSEARQGTE